MHQLHLLGVIGGTAITCVGTFTLSFTLICTHWDAKDALGRPLTQPSTQCRYVFTLLLIVLCNVMYIGFAMGFLTIGGEESSLMHICPLHMTKASCEGSADTLPAQWKAKADAVTPWPCVWRAEDPGLTIDQKLCANTNCRVDDNMHRMQLSIVYEYHTLNFWLVATTATIWFAIQIEELQGLGKGDAAVSPDDAAVSA